jgi:hypothetical protein
MINTLGRSQLCNKVNKVSWKTAAYGTETKVSAWASFSYLPGPKSQKGHSLSRSEKHRICSHITYIVHSCQLPEEECTKVACTVPREIIFSHRSSSWSFFRQPLLKTNQQGVFCFTICIILKTPLLTGISKESENAINSNIKKNHDLQSLERWIFQNLCYY